MPAKPSLPKVSEAARKAILKAAEKGTPRRFSALAAGLSERTVYRYLRAGRDAGKGVAWQFWQALQRAEAKAVAVRIDRIDKAGRKGNWKADTWFLESQYESHFGRNRRELMALQKQVLELSQTLEQIRAALGDQAKDQAAPADAGQPAGDAAPPAAA